MICCSTSGKGDDGGVEYEEVSDNVNQDNGNQEQVIVVSNNNSDYWGTTQVIERYYKQISWVN